MGVTDFRNRGRDKEFNTQAKLTIVCSADGKREVLWGNTKGKSKAKIKQAKVWIPRGQQADPAGRVTKPINTPINLVQVPPQKSFAGHSIHEMGESSNRPKPVIVKQQIEHRPKPMGWGPSRGQKENMGSNPWIQNTVVSCREEKYLAEVARSSIVLTYMATSLKVQTTIMRGMTRVLRCHISRGFEVYRGYTHEKMAGLDGMMVMGPKFDHRDGEVQDTVSDEEEEASPKSQIVPYSVGATMSEIVDTEAETDTVLDILPLNSYGGQNMQGLICDQSDWVRNHMEEFSTQMGVSITGCESLAMNLFVEIEKRWRQPGGGGSGSNTGKPKTRKGVRELKNLATSINYETPKKQGRGRKGRGSDGY